MDHNCLESSKTINSRKRLADGDRFYIYRRKECEVCGNRLTTVEIEVDSRAGVHSIDFAPTKEVFEMKITATDLVRFLSTPEGRSLKIILEPNGIKTE